MNPRNQIIIIANFTFRYIGILIGRLGLITPVARDEFLALLEQTAPGSMEVSQLENWLKELVRRHTGDPGTLMFDPNSLTNHCKMYVSLLVKVVYMLIELFYRFTGANAAGSITYSTKFRSYEVREGPDFNPPIWQVIRATLAYPGRFPGIRIGPDLIQEVYISGEFGQNNPSHEVIREFESQWKQQKVACLVNIGTGHKGVMQIEEINGLTLPASFSVALERMVTDSERIAEEVTRRFQGHSTYYRLNVEHGLDRPDNNRPVTMEEVVTHTNAYLRNFGVSASVDALVESLLYLLEAPLWSTTRDYFEGMLDSYIVKTKERVDQLDVSKMKIAAEEVVVTLGMIRVSELVVDAS